MSGCPDRTRLARFRAGGCDAAEASAIRAHLTACAPCRARFKDDSHAEPFAAAPASQGTPAEKAAAETDAAEGTFSLGLDDSERFALMQPNIQGYEFMRALGRGGQAYVFEALQTSTKRKVAVKILLEGPYASETTRRRFAREVELVAQLRHPNIITIFDSGVTDDGRPYYVMDYVRGLPLHAYARENRLPREAILRIFAAVCDGVHYAHTRGVVHRDLKPTNILVDTQGLPRVLDFGLAKLLAAPTDPGLSTSQAILGTLPYLAPEQTRGNSELIDARTDVYALGVILYELFTGKRPYPTDGSVHETFRNIVEASPVHPAQAWRTGLGAEERERSRERSGSHSSRAACPIDRDIETILMKALAKEPPRRYQSAAELAADVERYLEGDPISARRDRLTYRARKHAARFAARSPIAAGALVVLIAAIIGQSIGGLLAYEWTPAQRYYQQWFSARGRFDHCRMIAIQASDEFRRIAAENGVEGPDQLNNPRLRKLHGLLFSKLARLRPKLVVVDITFASPQPEDEGLVAGVKALRAAGVDVVAATANWPLAPGDTPAISPALAPEVRRGAVFGGCSEEENWFVVLAAQRGTAPPAPSLTLSAWAAVQRPEADPNFAFDETQDAIDVTYSQPDSSMRGGRIMLDAADRIRVSAMRVEDRDRPDSQTRDGDRIAIYTPFFPDDAAFEHATLDYARLFSTPDAECEPWVRDKVLVLGDYRPGADEGRHQRDSKVRPKAQVHLATLESLLKLGSLLSPRAWEQYAWVLCGVVCGMFVGWMLPRRWFVRLLLVAALALALTAIGIALLYVKNWMANPIPPILGMIIATALSSAAGRAVRPRSLHISERSSGT